MLVSLIYYSHQNKFRKVFMRLLRLLVPFFVYGMIATGISLSEASKETAQVNVYSHRPYDTDKALYDRFKEQTGITVNVIQSRADELIERLAREGAESPADVLITVDVGRLVRAKNLGLLQPASSIELHDNVPRHLRDPDGHWFALTQRARVIVYHPKRVTPNELTTYGDLIHPKWKGRILIRSSANIYNQSLLASIIAHEGKAIASGWAAGLVANMARTPQGNDRDQIKALVAGEGDLAIVNTYYVGRLINSSDRYERDVGAQVKVFFPNQGNRGTHINISGAGVTATAKNFNNAVTLLEFLTGVEAQERFSAENYEYPANPKVRPSILLQSWGTFVADNLDLYRLGELNSDAVKIFDFAGWR